MTNIEHSTPPPFNVQRAACSAFKVQPSAFNIRLVQHSAFTLIELLVVMVIIAILVSISFPVYTTIIEKARRTDALATIGQVRTALTAYQTEYSDWPPCLLTNSSNGSDASIVADTTYASPGKWQTVFRTLTATGDTNVLATNNKRRMVFMEFNPKQLDNKISPSTATTFLDPWGREFNIVVDANGDNQISGLPDTAASTVNTNLTINGSVAIWSYGKDPTKVKTYITSWK